MPGSDPGFGEIVYSNGYATMALARREGCEVVDLGIVPDRLAETAAAVRRARDLGADVLVTSGGASVGDYDLVQKALAAEGLELSFWKVALRPGRPMMHGRLGAMHVLGLPGNPVSAYVCAVLFLVPLIRRLAGRTDVEPQLRAGAARLRPAGKRRAGGLPARHACRRPRRPAGRDPGPGAGQLHADPARQRRLPADARAACARRQGRRMCSIIRLRDRFSRHVPSLSALLRGLSTCSRQIKWLRNTYGTYSVVHDLFRRVRLGRRSLGKRRDADPQAIRAAALHPRAPEGSRRAALLRRDEGRARPALEVRHPPPDHRARGARLHPPPAQPGARDRGDQAARIRSPTAWQPAARAVSRRA